MKWERQGWLVFVLTKVAFLWPFVWWGVEWERTLIVWVRFGSGSCLVCKVRVLFGSFKNEGSSSVHSVRVRFSHL